MDGANCVVLFFATTCNHISGVGYVGGRTFYTRDTRQGLKNLLSLCFVALHHSCSFRALHSKLIDNLIHHQSLTALIWYHAIPKK